MIDKGLKFKISDCRITYNPYNRLTKRERKSKYLSAHLWESWNSLPFIVDMFRKAKQGAIQ